MRKPARPHAIRKTSGPETRVSLGVALCSTAMILKWVLTGRVNHKEILHAVLQLASASGSVTKPREKCCNLIGRHYSGAGTNPR